MTKGQALQRTCAGASKGFLLKMRMGLSKQDLGKVGEVYLMDKIVCCTNLTLFGGSEIESEQYFVLCQGMIFNVFFRRNQ